MKRTASTILLLAALVIASLLSVSASLSGPTTWTPDGLFYQARSLELRGVEHTESLRRVFEGPLASDLRRIDPSRTGNREWVDYHARFYERRITVPLAAAALEPVSGDRALLDISLAGYVAAILALFWLLCLRFARWIAASVALAAALLPPLTLHSQLPLTDSWGLALLTVGLACGLLAVERGGRWIVAWTAVVLLLSLTRDSGFVLVVAAGGLALVTRSRSSLAMLATGVLAVVPVVLLFPVPTRELVATMLNDARPMPGASWGFIADRYPGALLDMLRADGGLVRRGEWYSALFLLGGGGLLFVLARGLREPGVLLIQAAALAGLAYVLVVPVFSALRLELAWVPMAAFGFSLGLERIGARASGWATAHVARPRRVPV